MEFDTSKIPDHITSSDDPVTNKVLDLLVDELMKHDMKVMYASREWIIKHELLIGIRHEHTKVVLARPKWMPERLYRWLLTTIVVVAISHDVEPEPKPEKKTTINPPAPGKEHLN